jgi:hypothetical protein
MSTTYEEKIIVGIRVETTDLESVLRKTNESKFNDNFFKNNKLDKTDLSEEISGQTGLVSFFREDYEDFIVGYEFEDECSVDLDEKGLKLINKINIKVMKELNTDETPKLYALINSY